MIRVNGGGAGGGAAGSITIDSTAITGGGAGRFLFQSATNKVTSLPGIYYDPAYTGADMGLSFTAHPATVMGSFYSVYTRTDTTATGYPSFQIQGNAAPTGDAPTTLLTSFKSTANKTGGNTYHSITSGDLLTTNSGTGAMTALSGASIQATNDAAAAIGTIIGLYTAARMTVAGSSATALACLYIDPTTDGPTRRGAITNYYNIYSSGMTLDANYTATNRYQLYLGAMGGAAATDDYSIYSLATQPSLLTGNLYVGAAGATRLYAKQDSSLGTYTVSGVPINTVGAFSAALTAQTSSGLGQALMGDISLALTSGSPSFLALFGINGNAVIGSTDDRTHNAASFIAGVNCGASYNGSGSFGAVYGNFISAGKAGSGALTTLTALHATVTVAGSGTSTVSNLRLSNLVRPTGDSDVTFTNIYGQDIGDMNPTASAAVSNPTRALRIQSQTQSGAYAIEQVGTDDLNVFMGLTKIGGTANHGSTVGTNSVAWFDGTAPAGTLTNGFSLYSAGGLPKTADSAGTIGFVLSASAITTEASVPDRTLTVKYGANVVKLAAVFVS